MKRYTLIYSILLALLFAGRVFAQDVSKQKQPIDKVKECIELYKTLSGLSQGGYSREVGEDAIDQFRLLFERDASIYWDLYKDRPDSISQLTLNGYIEKIKDVYFLKSPVVNYPQAARYSMSYDGRNCIVYLVKMNMIMDENDKPIKTNTVRLRFNVIVKASGATILGIYEDKRNTRVRSMYPAVNYVGWDNVANTLANKSKSAIPMLSDSGFSASVSQQISYGAGVDLRLNREVRDGTIVSLAVFYSQVTYDLSTGKYTHSYLDTLDTESANPFSLTVFDRTSGITEKLKVTSIEIPITIKKYFNPYFYAKGGIQFTLSSATTDIRYLFDHTGGGLLTNLNHPEQWRYLQEDQELKNITGYTYEFYTGRSKDFSKVPDMSKIGASIVLGFGMEKQFTHFSFGIEPLFRIGNNQLFQSNAESDLIIAEEQSYSGLLSTTEQPAYRISAGVSFYVSYLFKH